ncbi:MAG: Spore protein SP21 [Pelotomaculum sp. PtaB.Bin013]|uniref:Hsp20/alpha crystallin family protein n=1 Tax=Pelotomaculum isophthalicicum JI TaxID=947010 RepID=A0A9X4JTD9_9FIRM|nr:Hsp20/alpha crystallin family protein [Pelotomaculum isophthalicicum]MDF9407300.1 Hsp20/alpha crystallin family protein [Pelotomaculum isophthalicicum JI]OPX82721.1 MAG: Spore protein SP21 [Pelotomaculum sp. PtaB.Bin013]
MNKDPSIQEEQNSYPLMSGWPFSTSAMPNPWLQYVTGTIIPKVDIIENDSSIIYIYDLAGADSSKLNLEVSEFEVVITAPVVPSQQPNIQYIYQERPKGRYERILLPPKNVNIEGIKADFKDGILEVKFPKLSKRS